MEEPHILEGDLSTFVSHLDHAIRMGLFADVFLMTFVENVKFRWCNWILKCIIWAAGLTAETLYLWSNEHDLRSVQLNKSTVVKS